MTEPIRPEGYGTKRYKTFTSRRFYRKVREAVAAQLIRENDAFADLIRATLNTSQGRPT